MELLVFLVVSIFFGYMWYMKKYEESLKMIAKLPGPRLLPIIGNAMWFFGKSPKEILETIGVLIKIHGRTVRVALGNAILVMITDPKDAEVLLGSQKMIDKSNEYDFFVEWLGTGLLISTGNKWFARRKVITPTFHFKILEQFVEVFDKQSVIFVENMRKFKGRAFDCFPLVTLCALDVICETAMGVQVNAQKNSDDVYVKAVKEMSILAATRMFDVLKRIDFLYQFSSAARREKELLKILHNFTDSVIVARRAELEEKLRSGREIVEDDVGSKRKMALLDVLLQSTIDGRPLSNLDIREEVDTFVFEGHDTTTSGIAFCLYNLAKYPEVQKKVFEEIRAVIGDDVNKPVTQNDLNNLNYLDLVIKESLRLYPSVPMFARKLKENVEINGKSIPAGASVGVAPFFMARDETLWENALEFIPERFESDRVKIHPYGHVPFSAGPRNCIGQKFAILEMKSTVSKTLRHFQLSVAPGYEPELVAELILRPTNGVQLMIKDRVYV